MHLTINGHVRNFDHTSITVAELIDQLSATGKRIAVECNGEIVPKSQYTSYSLVDGDKLEIVGAVGGG